MVKNSPDNASLFDVVSAEVNFQAMLNCCCREFNNWSRYEGVPLYDAPLAEFMQPLECESFIRFDFKSTGIQVYAPVKYFSYCGVHSFGAPVFERDERNNLIRPIDAARFIEICADDASVEHPQVNSEISRHLSANSIQNLSTLLAAHDSNQGNDPGNPAPTFIEAEQSLFLGHSVHPVPKCREGFNSDELLRYSPETGGHFQLYYFLIHPDHATEKNADDVKVTEELKQFIAAELPLPVQQLIHERANWILVPVHPWEASFLLNNETVNEMLREQLIYDLGQFGPAFQATSSVRTVYNSTFNWMFKLSLHVKITNSYRINYPHELHRGYDAARLINTSWGENLKKEFPQIELIRDTGFVTVQYNGNVIDGFSVGVRHNPFTGAEAKKNIALSASFTQAGILGKPSRMYNVITAAAEKSQRSTTETAKAWFQQYLDITVKPLSIIFNKYGFGCEFHQQNTLIELNEEFFPCKLYFRDNQGYFFRQGMEDEIRNLVPDFGNESRLFIAEPRMSGFWGYYLVLNHISGIISALGREGFANELDLIGMLYDALETNRDMDTTGLIPYLLDSHALTVKCNLLTNLNNMDEASAPRTNPAVYRSTPNPLHYKYFSEHLIRPGAGQIAYSRYFAKSDVEIVIRPMEIGKDLEMLHEWFHRDHALRIWKMNWPLKELEDYYRTLHAGNTGHSYIGYANGVPTFNIEVYWACRDIVGHFYDVLPTDYGTHQFIAPEDPKLKYSSPSTQAMVDFVFMEKKVGKMVGEGSVESLASMMNKAHVGFRIEKVIELPDKKANLNFCYREWYWEKFPEAKKIHLEYVERV